MCQKAKDELRKKYLSIRSSLSEQEVETKSEKIIRQLLSSEPFKEAAIVHSYLPIKKNREVNTLDVVEHCFENDKIVVIPKVEADQQISHHVLNSFEELKTNNWGVAEPIRPKPVSVAEIDLVVVPMVCGDRNRSRIGYGKGFYDRFLSQTDAFKIGLLYNCTLTDEKIPVEDFDQKPDWLITEKEIIR